MDEKESLQLLESTLPGSAAPAQGAAGPGWVYKSGRFLFKVLKEILGTVLPAIFIALVINVFVAQAMVVHGPSMQPTLYYDERVVIEKVSYYLHEPRRGDIVVIDVPGQEEPLIKRVMALPGETVAVRSGQVYINDEPINEPWTVQLGGPDYPPTTVPPEHVFILGDNRGHSNDSRAFGPVHMDRILGRAWLVYWPLDMLGLIR
ncbi:MAG: signal peptidase I [Anaerolineae bacterium]|nr:signal peptidase I [Anaerolineae bacterium]